MKPSRTIKYKALFLLVSFSLNSVIGFACSLGVDMGFNKGHHEHNGKEQHKHSHNKHSDTHGNDHPGKHAHKHNHNHTEGHKQSTGNTVSFHAPEDENCCNGLVVDFQNLDKALAKSNSGVQQQHLVISPFVIAVIIGLNNTKGFAQYYRIPPKQTDLPPSDILALIQSFLI